MKKQTPTEYRRNLPHIQPQGGMFFITFRLFGSIPVSVIKKLSETYENENTTDISGQPIKDLKQAQQENYFLAIDDYLDNNPNSPYHLANPEIAQLVYDSIIFRDGKDYKLVCFCIMSNHVHMIIYKLDKPLDKIMQELKAYTGREANKLIGQGQRSDASLVGVELQSRSNTTSSMSSKFWQAESFDRIIRDRNDMSNKISYTLNNPVNAGLIETWKEWKWSYCRSEFCIT